MEGIELIRAKLIQAEQNGFGERTAEDIACLVKGKSEGGMGCYGLSHDAETDLIRISPARRKRISP